jgi:hypothetical protein
MRAGFILLRSGGAGSQAGVLSSRNHSVRTRSLSDLDRMITDCNRPQPAGDQWPLSGIQSRRTRSGDDSRFTNNTIFDEIESLD